MEKYRFSVISKFRNSYVEIGRNLPHKFPSICSEMLLSMDEIESVVFPTKKVDKLYKIVFDVLVLIRYIFFKEQF